MIQIVMKPAPDARVVNHETLYACLFNGEDVGLRVRGLKASHAEEKMMVVFREQLKGKTVSYDLETYKKSKSETGEDSEADQAGKPKDGTQEAFLPGMEDAR